MLSLNIKGSRKRRRSPSPYGADRYEPRPRYAEDYGMRVMNIIQCTTRLITSARFRRPLTWRIRLQPLPTRQRSCTSGPSYLGLSRLTAAVCGVVSLLLS